MSCGQSCLIWAFCSYLNLGVMPEPKLDLYMQSMTPRSIPWFPVVFGFMDAVMNILHMDRKEKHNLTI